jgi:dTDP-4-dehydrorhamnose reductase
MNTNELELWGGIECTVNRVGSWHIDQLELSGHSSRVSDIDRVRSLGIRTLRYPILWERCSPSHHGSIDWSWPDERMKRLEHNNITPIVGLVHHGSGPRYTNLLDKAFADKLGEYADAVARRYKSIRYVTPVNEPLTTARFSALYGHWYPHRKSSEDFATALLNQCMGIRAALRAMRQHIPDIELVQTEDVGRVSSTPRLSYQAEFENERRWLTFDLLCGRVTRDHPMWMHLALNESIISSLESLAADPCPPSIIGINYYVTSDRFLDERVGIHPPGSIGGNGRDRYADIEAVRATESGLAGHAAILMEAWNRYRLPLAITESHIGCTREHQVRWLLEAWKGACAARGAGCDVRAVTAWALFGSFGWDSLVTKAPFSYESGAFDVRGAKPRETAVAHAIRELTSSSACSIPVAASPGWWKAESRYTVTPFMIACRDKTAGIPPRHGETAARPLLVAGSRGTLGSAILRICQERGIAARGVTRSEMDITDPLTVALAIDRIKPWAVINAAGYVRVDDAEHDRNECNRINTTGAEVLSAECIRAGIRFVSFSSDLVFNGQKQQPYVESDRPSPINAYGASKAATEKIVLRSNRDALLIRTSAFFGHWDESNFAQVVLRAVQNGIPFAAAYDCSVSPTYIPDLANATLDLLIDGEKGIWHLANEGSITWFDFAREIASRTLNSIDLIKPVSIQSMGLAARRPAYSALASERGSLLSTLDDALNRWAHSIPSRTQAAVMQA